ncbi:MAG TPA: hypothetical protein VEL74_16335 [Thermoanaerobaculia bacterium]|nr:hypothetical protein [Thermoanaerobaculia bacterium]
MKRIRRFAIAFAVVAATGVAGFTSTAPAGACCRPCAGYCGTPGVPLSAACCSGVSTPGNACGFTNCCSYLGICAEK